MWSRRILVTLVLTVMFASGCSEDYGNPFDGIVQRYMRIAVWGYDCLASDEGLDSPSECVAEYDQSEVEAYCSALAYADHAGELGVYYRYQLLIPSCHLWHDPSC